MIRLGVALINYIYWHYTIAPARILGLLRNYLMGIWHRFLIPTHFKTLLSPWHRSNPSDAGGPRNFGDKIMNGVIDFYIRIIAAFVRLTIILIGLFAELVVIIVFVVLLIVWLVWPIVFVYLVSNGLALTLQK